MRLLRKRSPRVAIIGLDCAEPSLLFDRFAADLPTFARLRQHGAWGRLESVIPAITVPAWSCMMSGQDPGALGIYGFRNRADHSYDHLITANGDAVEVPRLWDILARHGKRSLVLNVPGTYPARPVNGRLISCFLTPDASAEFTWPPSLKADLQARYGEYPFDVSDFRTHDKQRLIGQIATMTRTHFDAARWLAKDGQWDLFAFVEIGLDRMHHAFWSFFDPAHRLYESGSPYADAIRNYYRLLDDEIAALLKVLGEDTAVLVVSDHGARRMDGGIALNEWLIADGYLTLAGEYPAKPTRPDRVPIDWSRTKAWGEGGYYGRLFLNITDREPSGIVPPEEVESLIAELRNGLSALGDAGGQPIGTRVFTPAEVYPVVNGVPPDLMIYFGDLSWRSIGSIGWGQTHIFENDTGPDDANHAQYGVIITHDPAAPAGSRELTDAHLLQVAPTVLSYFGIDAPAEMRRPALPVFSQTN